MEAKPKAPIKKIVLLSLLALFLAGAIVLATVLIVSASHRVLSFHGIRISDDVYAYWQARYRYEYLVNYAADGAEDTEAYWSSPSDADPDLTNGEACEALTSRIVERILAGAWQFDDGGYKMTDGQRKSVDSTLASIIENRFGGNEKKYRDAAEKYGFTEKSVREAYVYEIKATLLASKVNATDEQVDAFYRENFIRVKVLYLSRTSPSFSANRTYLLATLAENATTAGFDAFVADGRYNSDPGSLVYTDGYYLSPSSAFVEEYQALRPALISNAFSLGGTGDWTTFEEDGGTCFLMRYDLSDRAYDDLKNEPFFTDLASDATAHWFTSWLDSYVGEGEWHTEHIRAWVPAGRHSDLYLFF